MGLKLNGDLGFRLAEVEEARLNPPVLHLSDVASKRNKSAQPDSAVYPNKSFFQGEKSMIIEEGDKDAVRAGEQLGTEIVGAAVSAENLFVTSGKRGILTDQQAIQIMDDATGANPKDIIETTRGVDSTKISVVEPELDKKLGEVASDAYYTGDANKVATGMEEAAQEVESAEAVRERVKQKLDDMGVDEARQGEVLENLTYLQTTRLGEAQLPAEEILNAATGASFSLSSELKRQVRPEDVLDKTAQAIRDEQGSRESAEMLKQLLINNSFAKKAEKDPDWLEWLESIFSDKSERIESKAA